MNLLPCPFCGGPAKAFEWEDLNKPIELAVTHHHIVCDSEDGCPAGELLISADTADDAARKWNTRKHAQEDAAQEGARGEPITAAMLADAFGCFWNAAIGSEPVRHDSTAAATVSGIALGMAAIEARLREFAIDSEAK